jgi:predicted DNA-binding transcriptional regulator AlpA
MTNTTLCTTSASICESVGLLTADEISDVLQVSTKTLTTWRWKRRGPPSIKLGKKVFYLLADFSKWMQDEAARQRSSAAPVRHRVKRLSCETSPLMSTPLLASSAAPPVAA